MVRSVPLQSSLSLILEAKEFHRARSSSRLQASTICCSSRSHDCIPKLEPFSRSKIDRGIKEASFIQKSENDLADYCSTLEGDASYRCWRAYFELKDLERKLPKEEIEKIILQSDGVKSLVDCLHGISYIHKGKEQHMAPAAPRNSKNEQEKPVSVPDGLPKSQEEMAEEETSRMKDSPFTRLLRAKGRFPAWYSPAPYRETY